MTVASILAEKGREVVTARPRDTVGETARRLAERKIGAIVVTDGKGAIGGIVSERDLVRAVAERGAAALDEPISQVMTASVMTCALQDTIHQVMERMTHGRFRHLPVVEEGRLAGIISIGDVVKRRIEEVEREAEEMRSYIATA